MLNLKKERMDKPTVISINISKGGVPKLPVEQVFINESGLDGDGHNHAKHYRPTQAVCIQDIERLNELVSLGYPLAPGTTGENLTVRNLHVNALPVGAQLEFSSGGILEISRVRPTCYVMDQINPKLKEDADGRHGMYAKVIREGVIKKGDNIQVFKPSFI